MDEDEILNARQVAEQNPELDATRRQLFGENYLDDIDQGTGIAQYYTGFGQMPTLDYTPPVVEEAAPVVDVTQPVVDTGGGGGGAGISTGGDDDIDYSQNPLTQMITTPTGDTMTVKEAMTTDAAYTGTDQSGLGGADGMSGGQATPGAEFADQNPYGGTGTMDDLGADSFPEYQEPTVANLGSTAPGITDYLEGIDPATGLTETIDTRATEPPSLGFGTPPEADIYQDPIMGMANMNQADVIASDANVGFDTPEQTNAINEAFNSVKDLGEAGVDKLRDSLVALGGKVKEGFDNTVEIGGKAIDLTKSLVGGAISLVSGIPGVGLLLNVLPEGGRGDVSDALGEKYGMDDIGRLTGGPMAGYSVGPDHAQTVQDRIDSIENRTAPQTEASEKKIAELKAYKSEVIAAGSGGVITEPGTVVGPGEMPITQDEIDAFNEVETFNPGDVEAGLGTETIDDITSETFGGDRYGDGGPGYDGPPSGPGATADDGFDNTGFAGEGSGADGPAGGASNAAANEAAASNREAGRTGQYGGNDGADTGSAPSSSPSTGRGRTDAQSQYGGSSYGGGGGGGGGKIVCTMMNDSYGFGSFRNKIWLKHSKDLAPEYQIGYHKIFLPLVKLSKTNKVLKKTLEHIAVHRTIDIRQEARGKMHLLGRVYRKILEPICYIVGKHAKR